MRPWKHRSADGWNVCCALRDPSPALGFSDVLCQQRFGAFAACGSLHPVRLNPCLFPAMCDSSRTPGPVILAEPLMLASSPPASIICQVSGSWGRFLYNSLSTHKVQQVNHAVSERVRVHCTFRFKSIPKENIFHLNFSVSLKSIHLFYLLIPLSAVITMLLSL